MHAFAVEQALARPPADVGPALMSLREDQWFDRKSARITGKDLAESLVSFSNADGGIVVIGLWDGKVEGVRRARGGRVAEWQQAAIDFTVPTVPCRTRLVPCLNERGDDDELFVIDVEPSRQLHSNRRDDVYLRVGDENRHLNFSQRQELLYDKGQSTFETTVVPDASFDDLDAELLDVYARAVGHPEPKRLLSARGLLSRKGELTVGALLLFAAEPQRWYPEASVRVLRYRGSDRGTGARQQLTFDSRIEGPIPHQLSAARQTILEQIPTRIALGARGRFEPVGLLPEDAWLEALVNATIHRSYSVSGDHIRFEIFDDRVEIESPGRFPGIADASDPRHVTRFARNPRIARVCADLAFGQELGEGIRRIFDEMHYAGLSDPTYFQTSGSVRLTLSSALVNAEALDKLPVGARDLVRIIRDGQHLRTGEIADAAGRSRPVVIRQLNALREAGIIDWAGQSSTDPNAFWTIRTR